MSESAAEPFYKLLGEIRRPLTLREIMSVCLRHIYIGDPFSGEKPLLPPPPQELFDEVTVTEVHSAGIRCVLYLPKQRSTGVLLYMHGGGFVVGCSEDTDYTTRQLCRANRLAVISINYRLAPETVFPGAIEDCVNVLGWARQNGGDYGFDCSRVFVAGDSAGGNLAAAVALRLKRDQVSVAGAILLAPWLDMKVEAYDSYNRLAPEGVVYDAAFIGYCRGAYLRFEEWTDPLASPMLCDPKDLPPTLIFAGTADPLYDQCAQFTESARKAGCNHIELVTYDGMPHCFYTFPNVFAEEVDCYRRISEFVVKSSKASHK
jgi:acetyl esterase